MSCNSIIPVGVRGSLLTILLALAVTPGRPAIAAVFSWDGGGADQAFINAANWNPNAVPNDSADTAIFDLAATYTVETRIPLITNGNFEVRSGTVTFNLFDFISPIFDPTTTYRLDPASGPAALVGTTNGVSAKLVVRGRDPSPAFNPGFGQRGVIETLGDLRIATGDTSTGEVNIGASNTPGNQGQALWDSTGLTHVGNAGTGILKVFSGSELIDAGAILGVGDTATGTATITGNWTNNGNLVVGFQGDGVLNLAGGGVNTTGDASIGASVFGTTPSGIVNLTGGDWTIGDDVNIGTAADGVGVLTIDSSGSSMFVGDDFSLRDRGTVNLMDGQLTVNGDMDLLAGSDFDLEGGHLKTTPSTFSIAPGTFSWTSGTLEFDTGYTLQTGAVLGSSMTVNANKEFIVGGALNIGSSAAGTLNITAGGDVTSTGANIGGLTGAGTVAGVNLTGAGSSWEITGTLNVQDETAANLLVGSGATLTSGNAFASATPGAANSNIDLSGANTLWSSTGSVYLGGGVIAANGPGTLDVITGAKLTVTNILRIWEPYTVTLNGGTIETQHLAARGTVNATASSVLKATGDVDVLSGAEVSFDATSHLDFAGATVLFAGAAMVNARVVGDAATTMTVSSFGTMWTTPGDLEIGTASAGSGHLGMLALQSSTTTNVAGNVDVLDVAKFALAGGTLNAASVELGDQDFSGFGAINANFHTGGSVTATGNLVLGNAASLAGAQIGGTLDVGVHTVTINKKGFYTIGNLTSIAGGTLIVPNGVAIPVGNSLTAAGAIDGRIVAQAGSLIEASGDLTLGTVNSLAGYFSDGDVDVGAHTVTIADANEALLGSLTSLGDGANPGTLAAANGAVLEFGKNIEGYGLVDTPNDPFKPFINNGAIVGDSLLQPITLDGFVKGVGSFDNVVFDGTFSPGFSPDVVLLGDAIYASGNTLVMELGGTAPGSGHDQIIHSGMAVLGGTLDIRLIDDFTPSLGDTFLLIVANQIAQGSDFESVLFPSVSGLLFSLERDAVSVTLNVGAVPLPPAFWLLAGALLFLRRPYPH